MSKQKRDTRHHPHPQPTADGPAPAPSQQIDPKEWGKAVRKADAAWRKARKVKDEFTNRMEIPDGKYSASIASATVGVHNGNPWMRIGLVVTYPEEYEGTQGAIFLSLRNEASAANASKCLQRLGYDSEKVELDDWPSICNEIVGFNVSITVKTNTTEKGEFQNIYINSVLK